MSKVFEEDDIELTNPVTFTVISGVSSMAATIGLLSWLEKCGAKIKEDSWEARAEAIIIDPGVTVEFEDVIFKLSCTHDKVFFTRLKGEEHRFWGLCKLFCDTEG